MVKQLNLAKSDSTAYELYLHGDSRAGQDAEKFLSAEIWAGKPVEQDDNVGRRVMDTYSWLLGHTAGRLRGIDSSWLPGPISVSLGLSSSSSLPSPASGVICD